MQPDLTISTAIVLYCSLWHHSLLPPHPCCVLAQALLQKSAAGRQAYFQAEMLTQAERIVRWVPQQMQLACCQDVRFSMILKQMFSIPMHSYTCCRMPPRCRSLGGYLAISHEYLDALPLRFPLPPNASYRSVAAGRWAATWPSATSIWMPCRPRHPPAPERLPSAASLAQLQLDPDCTNYD